MSSLSLSLQAPLSGPLVPIDQVPDPVFAQRMVGDGISIDPVSNQLLAPCDGKVTQVHPSQHAVTLMTDSGLEVMMHIGIDTVSLKGKGFEPLVKEGDAVKTGDALITIDLEYVATNAKSLLTQVVITNADGATLELNDGAVVAGKDWLFRVKGEGEIEAETTSISLENALVSDPIQLANPSGLHARPAAVLSKAAKKFKSNIQLVCGEKAGNAKSTTAIMKLNVGPRAMVVLRAEGADASAAIESLTAELLGGLGEDVVSQTVTTEAAPTAEVVAELGDTKLLSGVSASDGLVIGTAFQLKKQALVLEEFGGEATAEQQKLDQGLKDAQAQLAQLAAENEIFAAHQELLEDPELLEAASTWIAKGKSAGFAWQQAYQQEADSLAQLDNDLLAERANDLRDVGERTLKLILGHADDDLTLPKNCILIADDLTPSQTATLDRDRVIGFCTVKGGSTSHVAILARGMGLPAIAGLDARALQIANDTQLILDGTNGTLELNPDDARVTSIRTEMDAQAKQAAAALAVCADPAITTDQTTVVVAANAAECADVVQSAKLGGEGIGLLRTEILFHNQTEAPSEAEQEAAYREMIAAIDGKGALVVRTLDVGGDKPLPYLPLPKEENPFLGERGIRVSLNRPELFRAQIRAILRAAQAGELQIMFPMVTTLDDFTRAKAIVEEERLALELPAVPVGIMVEVPAVALMADVFAEEADFFSVGTNDLAQYTLAIDRGHPLLAAQADGLSPAVLRLIGLAADAMNSRGKSISVCGGLASDPKAVPLLIGLGVKKLSVSAPAVPTVKAQIRALSMAECQKLAQDALAKKDATEVRTLVAQANA